MRTKRSVRSAKLSKSPIKVAKNKGAAKKKKILLKKRSIVIPYCTGVETIDENGKDVFFETGSKYKPEQQATRKRTLDLYLIKECATIAQSFQSLGVALERLSVTEHQILAFFRTKEAKKIFSGMCNVFFLCRAPRKKFYVCTVGMVLEKAAYHTSLKSDVLHGSPTESIDYLVTQRIIKKAGVQHL
jgi:hypothetical protein